MVRKTTVDSGDRQSIIYGLFICKLNFDPFERLRVQYFSDYKDKILFGQKTHKFIYSGHFVLILFYPLEEWQCPK